MSNSSSETSTPLGSTTSSFTRDDQRDGPVELADRLVAWFSVEERYAVALSGGVDSSVVTKAASLSGADVIACTSVGASVAAVERQDASRLAQLIGIEHRFVDPAEIDEPAYRANDHQRCYHCKTHLYSTIARTCPGRTLLSGTNLDDLGDFRPGLKAAEEFCVRAPLAELKIDKAHVRLLAAFWELDIADKPASPCLASRVAYGIEVTAARLTRIEAAETLLREIGFGEFRVRLHADELARIEVPGELLGRLIQPEIRDRVVNSLGQLGFRYVTLDLEGFRSGSLNPLVNLSSSKPKS